MTKLFEVHKNALNVDQLYSLEFFVTWVTWQDAPRRLGSYSSRIYGTAFGKNYGKLPRNLRSITRKLESLVAPQRLTTATVHRYQVGSLVKPHRDPSNYRGYAVSVAFGKFKGGDIVFGKKTRVSLHPGDAIVYRCSVNRLPRPLQRIEPVTEGVRYTLTLNTII